MSANVQALTDFQPSQAYFIGIDSDGCVFDSMEIKHKECFAPMFIKHFRLQAASKYAREVWEFVNLYSKTRGINRFPALSNALNLLAERPEGQARGVQPWKPDPLDDWMARAEKLSNAGLQAEIDAGNAGLQAVMDWSKAVNAAIEDIVFGVPPFPYVRECLERMQAFADVVVVSQTPTEALEREWVEHQLEAYPRVIAGQELGTKTEHLRLASGGKYEPRRVLMIGDAPGDFKAAKANHALFFPILPGAEEASWRRLLDEGLDRFAHDTFAGEYEATLLREFNTCLPERPPWQR